MTQDKRERYKPHGVDPTHYACGEGTGKRYRFLEVIKKDKRNNSNAHLLCALDKKHTSQSYITTKKLHYDQICCTGSRAQQKKNT